MSRLPHSPVLAEAADVIGRQMREHLNRMAQLLGPCGADLDRQFVACISAPAKKSKATGGSGALSSGLSYDVRQTAALKAITPGSAIRFWLKDGNLDGFFEQVSYSGRRLAKLNLAPADIVKALASYDVLLDKVLAKTTAAETANFRWVREQLQFCVMLSLNNAYYEVREAESQAFYELFREEVSSRGLNDLYFQFLATLKRYTRADDARYITFDSDGNTWTAIGSNGGAASAIRATKQFKQWLGKPQCQRNTHTTVRGAKQTAANWASGYTSVWSMPLIHEGVLTGAFQFAFHKLYEWLPREQELLAAAIERCVEAAAKARLLEDLRAREEQIRHLAEHMLQVEEMERRRISGELHDEAGQSMLYVRLQMEMIEHALQPEQLELRQKVKQTREATERTIIEIRRLIAALSPATLEQLGLAPALRHLVTRFKQWYPAKVKLNLGNLDGLPKKTEVVVYRLVQECFNNISKHSSATWVNISAQTTDGLLSLIVEDNGVGFDVELAATKRESFGLQGMRERVQLLGGQCDIASKKREPGGKLDAKLLLTKASLRKRDREIAGTKRGLLENGKKDIECEVIGIPATGGHTVVASSRGARQKRGGRQQRIRATRSGTKIWIQLPVSREAVAA